MLARKLEQVEPLIDVGSEDRIARHPVGKFRVVEWRVWMELSVNYGSQLYEDGAKL